MKLNKEKIAFIVVVAIVGYLTWDALSSDGAAKRKSRKGGGAVPEYELDTLKYAFLANGERGWDEAGRNVYRAPSEHSPLPPLSLPAPPRDAPPVAPPQTVPGLGVYQRVKVVAPIEVVEGVDLSPRESRIVEDEIPEEDLDEETALTDGTEPGASIDIGEDVLDGITELVEDAVEQERATSPPPGVEQEEPKETPAERRRRERRERKILGLRERLAKKAAEELEEDREKAAREEKIESVRDSLDKIHWQSGEVWYGKVQNDAERIAGAPGFDRYEIKLTIDRVRADASMPSAQREERLRNRELEVEFRRWRVGKRGLDNMQKHSAVNIDRVEFANTVVNRFQIRRRQLADADIKEHLALARELVDAGEYGLAKNHLLWLLEREHKTRDLYVLLADSARRDFDYEVEMRALDEGLATFEDDADLLASLGDMYSRLGLSRIASTTLEEAVERAPTSPRAHGRLGRHVLEEGDVVRGRAARALESLDRAAAGRSARPAERAEILLARGQALLRLGRFNDASTVFGEVYSNDPSSIGAQLGLGAVAHARGDDARAKEIYEAVLEAAPETGVAYYDYGIVLMALGEWEPARNALYDAMEADPFLTAKARCALGYLYERLGQPNEAQVHYSAAREADPEDPQVLYWHARGSLLLGDHESAHETFLLALEGMPDQHEVLSALAETSYMLGRHEDSLRYADAALELDPDSATLLVRRAQALARLRRFEQAKENLDLAKKKKATDEVELSLAHYYYEQGNHVEALKRFRAVERSLERIDGSPIAEYTRRYAEEIEDNLSKQVWSDHFNRVSTGKDLLRGWKTHAPGSAISVGLLQNRVSFTGKQRRSETPSCIFQQRRGKEFVSFEAGFYVPRRAEITCGVGLFTFRKNTGDQNPYGDVFSGGIAYEGIMIAKTPEGRVAWRTISRYEMGRWQDVPGSRWPDNEGDEMVAARLGIEVADEKKGTFNLSFDGADVATEVEVRGLMRSNKEIQLWAFTQAEIDRRVDVKLDDVRIVTRKDVR